MDVSSDIIDLSEIVLDSSHESTSTEDCSTQVLSKTTTTNKATTNEKIKKKSYPKTVINSSINQNSSDKTTFKKKLKTKYIKNQTNLITKEWPNKDLTKSSKASEPIEHTVTITPIPSANKKLKNSDSLLKNPIKYYSNNSSEKIVNVINSTKIVIKSGTATTKLTEPLPATVANGCSPQPSSSSALAKNDYVYKKNILNMLANDYNDDEEVDDVDDNDEDEDDNDQNIEDDPVLTYSNDSVPERTSTPKIKREIKQLQKMMNDSKILTEFIQGGETKVRKVKKLAKHDEMLTDHDESIAISLIRRSSRSLSCSHRIESNSNGGGSRKSAATPDSGSSSSSIRRNMRSQNAEFSAKHQKFLRGIQSQQDSDASDNTSDNEKDDERITKNCLNIKQRQHKTVHPPPKVSNMIFLIFRNLAEQI